MIVQYPPTKPLTSEEGDLVWKFRFYLSSQKKVRRLLWFAVAAVIQIERESAQVLLPRAMRCSFVHQIFPCLEIVNVVIGHFSSNATDFLGIRKKAGFVRSRLLS